MKGVSFNIKYVKGLKKVEFIKKFRKIYPKLDLGSIYDSIKKGE